MLHYTCIFNHQKFRKNRNNVKIINKWSFLFITQHMPGHTPTCSCMYTKKMYIGHSQMISKCNLIDTNNTFGKGSICRNKWARIKNTYLHI